MELQVQVLVPTALGLALTLHQTVSTHALSRYGTLQAQAEQSMQLTLAPVADTSVTAGKTHFTIQDMWENRLGALC